MSTGRLTQPQKFWLGEIERAGSDGLIIDKAIVAPQSLLRKGLVTRVDVETLPATKVYTERDLTHTIRGKLRYVTLCRYWAAGAKK